MLKGKYMKKRYVNGQTDVIFIIIKCDRIWYFGPQVVTIVECLLIFAYLKDYLHGGMYLKSVRRDMPWLNQPTLLTDYSVRVFCDLKQYVYSIE